MRVNFASDGTGSDEPEELEAIKLSSRDGTEPRSVSLDPRRTVRIGVAVLIAALAGTLIWNRVATNARLDTIGRRLERLEAARALRGDDRSVRLCFPKPLSGWALFRFSPRTFGTVTGEVRGLPPSTFAEIRVIPAGGISGRTDSSGALTFDNPWFSSTTPSSAQVLTGNTEADATKFGPAGTTSCPSITRANRNDPCAPLSRDDVAGAVGAPVRPPRRVAAIGETARRVCVWETDAPPRA